MIKLIECIESLDNWGRVKLYKDIELYELLTTPNEWSDDQVFIDSNYKTYFIDELIGKKVKVDTIIFTVQ